MNRIKTYFNGRRPGINLLAFYCALFILCADNGAFWRHFHQVAPLTNGHALLFGIAVATLILASTVLFFGLCGWRYLFKPAMSFFFVAAAALSYFMREYGVVVDQSMVRNILETDPAEVAELLSAGLLLQIFLLGILPALLLWLIPVRQTTARKEFFARLRLVLLCLLAAGLSFFPQYKEFTFVGSQHKELRYYINPLYTIYALAKYAPPASASHPSRLRQILSDARQRPHLPGQRRRLLIIVAGETARTANFSLNGYQRETNPELGRQEIISFTNTWSCGTATATSLPCMFAAAGRQEFDRNRADHTENLLDGLQHAGLAVLWRDNNSGCKGVCNRIPYTDMAHLDDQELCTSDECYDEILLRDLQEYIDSHQEDTVIVLHQKGSHGPAYYKRYPSSFNVYQPVCRSSEVQQCDEQEIVNAYDNTIRYTDHFLAEVISLLQAETATMDTAMLYMSDHGESLGENGVYLHGLPWLLAPEQQKHIPFIVWLSDEMADHWHIDRDCLRQHDADPYSHDNLFHSILGLLDITTESYQADLDLFHQCRTKPTG